MTDEHRLRKGQIYTWQEVMDWAGHHDLLFDHHGDPDKWAGEAGLDLRVIQGERAAFLCAGLNDGGVTLWTCTYVHWEYALPPEDYTAWNKVMQCLEAMYQAYNGTAGQYRPHNEVLAELMTAYDEWLD